MATVAPVRESRRGHASANTTAEARIGPNAVLQTLGALEDAEGHKMARRLHVLAAIPPTPTDAMIPEAHFVALVAAVRETLPPARAEAVLAESGRRTAAYVSAHRIPGFAHTVLAGLPTRLALPALLSAIGQHAWTFAGAGVFAVEGSYPGVLTLQHTPTCRENRGAFSGAYYQAAFEGLLQLACPGIVVREVACQAAGADACRFTLSLPARGWRLRRSTSSSASSTACAEHVVH